MATLKSLTRTCGNPLPTGTKGRLYLIPKAELTGMPATKADNGGTAAGDGKIYDEPWPMVATSGLGYWRIVDILIKTGQLREDGEGEIGFQRIGNRLDFFVVDNGPAQQEGLDTMIAFSGCLIAMVETKAGRYHVVGNIDDPCYVESVSGGATDARVGYAYVLYADTGVSSMIYDAATHGIDITPNA